VLRFVGRRFLSSVPVLFLASLVVFSMLHLVPGDPVDAMIGSAGFQTGATRQETVDRIRDQLGLNEPLPVQYVRWLGGALRGDLGESFVRSRPVTDLIAERVASTLQLALAALVITVLFGMSLGILAALKHGTWVDAAVMVISMGGVTIPNFWFSMLLILLFSVVLGWLPATGSGGVERLILPALALGYEGVAMVARLTRRSMLEVLNAHYITTAHSKGLGAGAVVLRHALRNALIPIVTVTGLQLGHLLAGSVIVETVFAREGLGQLAIEAILTKDYPLVQGVILLTAGVYIVANLLVDLSYGYLDPRIRAA
jgi:ABC-type dipeptide/oligopeptide/nickel transport system permease component